MAHVADWETPHLLQAADDGAREFPDIMAPEEGVQRELMSAPGFGGGPAPSCRALSYEGTARNTVASPRCRPTLVAMAAIGVALGMIVVSVGFGGARPSPAPMGSTRNLMEAPQLRDIVVEEAYDAWGDPSLDKEALREHAGRILSEVGDLLDDHLGE